jgi:hypothetical protein
LVEATDGVDGEELLFFDEWLDGIEGGMQAELVVELDGLPFGDGDVGPDFVVLVLEEGHEDAHSVSSATQEDDDEDVVFLFFRNGESGEGGASAGPSEAGHGCTDEKAAAPEDPDRGKAALTALFEEVRTKKTPIIVARVVADIDAIVKPVRFDGWQRSTAGERDVKQALRKALLQYKLHTDQELFDRAYGYIKQYY